MDGDRVQLLRAFAVRLLRAEPDARLLGAVVKRLIRRARARDQRTGEKKRRAEVADAVGPVLREHLTTKFKRPASRKKPAARPSTKKVVDETHDCLITLGVTLPSNFKADMESRIMTLRRQGSGKKGWVSMARVAQSAVGLITGGAGDRAVRGLRHVQDEDDHAIDDGAALRWRKD